MQLTVEHVVYITRELKRIGIRDILLDDACDSLLSGTLNGMGDAMEVIAAFKNYHQKITGRTLGITHNKAMILYYWGRVIHSLLTGKRRKAYDSLRYLPKLISEYIESVRVTQKRQDAAQALIEYIKLLGT